MSFYASANSNPQAVQSSLLGPSYSYKDQIYSPSEIGMSDRGTMDALGNDVTGLIGYVSILVDGGGKASKPGGPLGNKYFMKTGAKCLATDTNQEVDRYIYMNNVPNAPLPGLIKGVAMGVTALNPFRIMGAFAEGSKPPCKEITMEVIDVNNNRSQASHYVTLSDIKSLEGFQNYDLNNSAPVELPNDLGVQLYFITLSGLGLYLVYKLMNKSG
jgi:hypothetical protein